MAIEVHVSGRVQLGHFAEFLEAAERWREFRAERGSASCIILQALSGEMNTVRLVFAYPDAAFKRRRRRAMPAIPSMRELRPRCRSWTAPLSMRSSGRRNHPEHNLIRELTPASGR